MAHRLTQEQAMSFLWQQLQLLPKLSELRLSLRLSFNPATAADIAPLRHLQRLQHLVLAFNGAPFRHEPAARELLAALWHLTQLQSLQLSGCQLHKVQPQPALQHQQQEGRGYRCFAALTASTHLTSLQLWDSAVPIPQEAVDCMFPAGHVLPHLKVLRLLCHDKR
jgi:hypothetical protein